MNRPAKRISNPPGKVRLKTQQQLFGTKLRLLRAKKGLSQEDCCRKTLCTLRTWRRWEKGETQPSYVYKKFITTLLPELGTF